MTECKYCIIATTEKFIPTYVVDLCVFIVKRLRPMSNVFLFKIWVNHSNYFAGGYTQSTAATSSNCSVTFSSPNQPEVYECKILSKVYYKALFTG